MVILAYGTVIILNVCQKNFSIVWKIPVLAVFRTISWMYVILANRVPARISHPLYYIELIVLFAWILVCCRKQQEKTHWLSFICACVLAGYACVKSPEAVTAVKNEMDRRDAVNETMLTFEAYAEQNAQNYYYMDVYSTVAFSEKMFENVDNSRKNYDLLGGWVSGSPLQKAATLPYYWEEMAEAELLLKDNFYFVIEKNRDIHFLNEYYGTQGINLQTELIDEIGNDENPLQVYQITVNGL